MYIIFEGVDTCGKSTQIDILKQNFPQIITTKEPGGTSLGVQLRQLLLTSDEKLSINAELLLFLADRAEHFERVVRPNSDKYVLSDRGFISGIAYALANHPELDLGFLVELNKFALGGNFPHKVVLFQTTKELILSRMSGKREDKIEQRGVEYLIDVQSNMKKILDFLGLDYLCIDASESIEDISKQIKEYIFK